jgi:hypothetical protein
MASSKVKQTLRSRFCNSIIQQWRRTLVHGRLHELFTAIRFFDTANNNRTNFPYFCLGNDQRWSNTHTI